jgi:hypothetical protein
LTKALVLTLPHLGRHFTMRAGELVEAQMRVGEEPPSLKSTEWVKASGLSQEDRTWIAEHFSE